jgi:hypothetical protein
MNIPDELAKQLAEMIIFEEEKPLSEWTESERRLAARTMNVFAFWLGRNNILSENESIVASATFARANNLPYNLSNPQGEGWVLPKLDLYEEALAFLNEVDADEDGHTDPN